MNIKMDIFIKIGIEKSDDLQKCKSGASLIHFIIFIIEWVKKFEVANQKNEN